MSTHTLQAQPLSAAGFAPFGYVVALDDQIKKLPSRPINHGNATRFDLVADLQLDAQAGRPALAIFRAKARVFPHQVTEMERHVLGSQTFIPLGSQRFIIVVARAGSTTLGNELQAFITNGRQGIVLAPGTWHHALLAMDDGDFAVIERVAAIADCDVVSITDSVYLMNPL